MIRANPIPWFLFLLLGLLSTVLVAGLSYRGGLERVDQAAQLQLDRATDRLLGQLAKYRYLPTVLSRHPVLLGVLAEEVSTAEGNRLLQSVADVSGARDITLTDAFGTTLAASNAGTERSSIGQSYADSAYFQQAMDGALGYSYVLGAVSSERGFYFSRSMPDSTGAVTVKVDLETLEAEWRGDPETVLFSGKDGAVFLSNRSELVFRTLTPGLPETPFREIRRFGKTLWTSDDPELPKTVLTRTRPVPQIGMEARILVASAPARRDAALAAAITLGFLMILALGLLVVLQRRAQLEERLKLEAALNAELEARVEARTAELMEARNRLVQADKLSALGQMSAGISHELNQPIAAIQTFAENAEMLMDRGKETAVRGNLGEIRVQTNRMDRIIRNLRAFARKEAPEIVPIDVAKAIDHAVSLATIRAERESVRMIVDASGPVMAVGGDIRLQQVLLNLINNAMDAMQGQDDKEIEIRLEAGPEIAVHILDTGPGLEDADKVFEPFYTTKPVDHGQGLGLGLSISYGIVQSFGGDIVGRNRPQRGAAFTIALQPAEGAA